MTTITLELPDGLLAFLHKSPMECAFDVRLAAACQWYAQGLISHGKGAEIAGISRAEFIDALASRHIPVGQYTIEEVMKEIESV